MTDFYVEVAPVLNIQKHPNADTLSIAEVLGNPVIIRTGEYTDGELAVYVPVDAIVPSDDPRWAFLSGNWRIKAKKLRGVYSQGILTKADPSWATGQDVRAELRIEKHDPGAKLELSMRTNDESQPGWFHLYTDIEGYRKHKTTLVLGEEVVLTEKIHGANARYCFRDGRLWVGSRTRCKLEDPRCMWWAAARRAGLDEKLRSAEGITFYGEVYGQVQDLKYGAGQGDVFFRAFDAMDTRTGKYLDHGTFAALAETLGIECVPELYRGPWDVEVCAPLRNGQSTMPGAGHMREGFVVKPMVERWEHRLGRVILKFVGEDYLLRKGA